MKELIYLKFFYKNYFKAYLKNYLRSGQKTEKSRNYLDIGILNPTIGTSNLGDFIVYESIYKHLREVFQEDLLTSFPTQIHTSFDAKYLMSQKDLLFVAGTNLLASNIETRLQWKVNYSHKRFLRNKVVLFGCGWWQYQNEVNQYTARIYQGVFNQDLIHAVRDSYTVEKLHSIGIKNVVNTSCPTLWRISPEACKSIPVKRKENVITTLTSYNKNPADDLKMLELLSKNYGTVYYWLQSYDDILYLNEIKAEFKNIRILPPTLEALDTFLATGGVDYIGTRLHAGIRALQHHIRTLVLAVDNRATEIGKDVNLNVTPRENVEEITTFIHGEYCTDIRLPEENIRKFKNSLIGYK